MPISKPLSACPVGKGKADVTCIRCKHDTARKFGTCGKSKIQRYRCKTCSATFSDRKPAPILPGHTTDQEKAVQSLSKMLEGMSIRAIC